MHGAEWALQRSLDIGWRLLEAGASPRKAARLIEDTRGVARSLLRELKHRAAGADPAACPSEQVCNILNKGTDQGL